MTEPDPRRQVPRTDRMLADQRLAEPLGRLGPDAVKAAVRQAQQQVRVGELDPDQAVPRVLELLPELATSLRPVLNATGVVLHTNLGRAPLAASAVRALVAAAGYLDVEFELGSGRRAPRGRGTLAALRDAVPAAEDVLVLNNGAAALVLATTALAAGREVIVSRGELVEIGDGFRLPELIESTGARIREVGTTNRSTLADYAAAVGPDTGCVLKVHPSNFVVSGFTASVAVRELATLGVPVLADVGSGMLGPDPLLADEPDVLSALRDGAGVVTCSGDKLLGGPQAGLLFGRAELVTRIRRHPLARALRVDKLTLAALEATLRGPATPTWRYLHADPEELRLRCQGVAAALAGAGISAGVVPSAGAVGGGGAPELALPGWAVAVAEAFAEPLRLGQPAVVGRLEHGRCLLDLRCIEATDEPALIDAVSTCAERIGAAGINSAGIGPARAGDSAGGATG